MKLKRFLIDALAAIAGILIVLFVILPAGAIVLLYALAMRLLGAYKYPSD